MQGGHMWSPGNSPSHTRRSQATPRASGNRERCGVLHQVKPGPCEVFKEKLIFSGRSRSGFVPSPALSDIVPVLVPGAEAPAEVRAKSTVLFWMSPVRTSPAVVRAKSKVLYRPCAPVRTSPGPPGTRGLRVAPPRGEVRPTVAGPGGHPCLEAAFPKQTCEDRGRASGNGVATPDGRGGGDGLPPALFALALVGPRLCTAGSPPEQALSIRPQALNARGRSARRSGYRSPSFARGSSSQ